MSYPLKAAIFFIATVLLIWLSRRSLCDVRSHGFHRFFAWEAILALALINLDYWFAEPFGLRQLVSWVLLFGCVYPVTHGTILLHRVGRPDTNRDGDGLLGIEKTTRLVTVGVYRYIRHPLYSSLLLLTWGAFLKHISWVSLTLALTSSVFLTLTAWREEAENIAYFGEDYVDYMKRTRRFIPFLF